MTKKNKHDQHDQHYINEASTLIDMLTYPRPSKCMDHPVYQEFLNKYITPVFGKPDKHGNFIRIVLDETIEAKPISGYPKKLCITEQFPTIAYMAHHDTVHAEHCLNSAPFKDRLFFTPTKSEDEIIEEKRKLFHGKSENFKPYLSESDKQRAVELYVSKPDKITVEKHTKFYQVEDDSKKRMKDMDEIKTVEINDPSQPNINCLGADCTVGVWLILEMINSKIPGVYVIHAQEEIGRLGAEALIKEYDECDDKLKSPYYWLDLIDVAVSFDRNNIYEIITHQSGKTRCASDKFADSLSAILSPDLTDAGYKKLVKSDRGSFTDSYSYRKNVAECINLCVGYYGQHGPNERQDLKFAVHLRDALIKHGFDINDPNGPIDVQRDPTEVVTNTVTWSGNQQSRLVNNEKKQLTNTSQTPASNRSSSPSMGSTTVLGQTNCSKQDTHLTTSEQWNSPYFNNEDGELLPDYSIYDEESWFTATDPLELAKNLMLEEAIIEPDEQVAIMDEICHNYSDAIAQYLYNCGTTLPEIVEYITNSST